jgi:hypothetical protein
MPSPRITLVEIQHIPEEGGRMTTILDAYATGRVRVALFWRLSMRSNPRGGVKL